jgi:hypothetical protein
MRKMCSVLAVLAVLLLTSQAWASPVLSGSLVLHATMTDGAGGSSYNPRIYGSNNYTVDITTGTFGKWATGSSTATSITTAGAELHRMVGEIPGSGYLMAASGAAANNLMTRYNSDGTSGVTADDPIPEASSAVATYAWTGTANRFVANAYKPNGDRGKLYVADVTPSSFATSLVSSFTTSATYIRSVSTGSTYTNTAYYGDGEPSGTGSGNFWAMDLATGAETLLGNFGWTASSTGAYDKTLWTVAERGGYLYVQGANGNGNGNVVQVYAMSGATALASSTPVVSYSGATLTALTGRSEFYGFDATADGQRMLFSSNGGQAFEIVPEPATGVLAIGALVAFLLFRWRKSRVA